MAHEDLRGTGKLWLNQKLLQSGLRYVVHIETGGILRGVTGRIDVNPLGDGMSLMVTEGIAEPNSDLVLELEDGRRWHCVLKNNSGDLLNSGKGFEGPEGSGA